MTISLQSCLITPPPELVESLKQRGLALLGRNYERVFHYPNSKGDDQFIEACKRITPHWSGNVLITDGATQALQYALQLVGTNKKVALYVPAYFEIFDQAKALRQTILPWQNVEELKRLGKVDAIICTSNFTPPSGISFSENDKQAIADIAKRHNAYVIEDNAYDSLWFSKNPPKPIPADPNKSIRIGSCSKNVAPGLRLGFVRAIDSILEKIRGSKIRGGLGTKLPDQWLALPALSPKCQKDWRDVLHQRSDTFRAEAERQLKTSIPEPEGGPYLSLDINVDPLKLAELSKSKGLLLDTNGGQFPNGRARSPLRLNLAAIKDKDIPKAVTILHKSIKELQE